MKKFKTMIILLLIFTFFESSAHEDFNFGIERYQVSPYKGVTYHDGKYVTVGSERQVMLYENNKWSSVISEFDGDLFDAVWNGKYYIALNGRYNSQIVYSENGTDWMRDGKRYSYAEILGSNPATNEVFFKFDDWKMKEKYGTSIFSTVNFIDFEPLPLNGSNKICYDNGTYFSYQTVDEAVIISKSTDKLSWKSIEFEEFFLKYDKIIFKDGSAYVFNRSVRQLDLYRTSDFETWSKTEINEIQNLSNYQVIKQNGNIHLFYTESGSAEIKQMVIQNDKDGLELSPNDIDIDDINFFNAVFNEADNIAFGYYLYSIFEFNGENVKKISLLDYNQENKQPLVKLNTGYLQEINGKQYITCRNYPPIIYTEDIPYVKEADDFFTENYPNDHYEPVGENYAVYTLRMDPQYPNYSEVYNTIQFFDKNFQLIHTQQFDGFVHNCSHYNMIYYCTVSKYPSKNESIHKQYKSSDLIHWEESNDIIPDVFGMYSKQDPDNPFDITEFKTFDGGNSYYKINFEETGNILLRPIFGTYRYKTDSGNICISSDGVYYLKCEAPFLENYSGNVDIIYESNDRLVFQTNSYLFYTPKQPLYDALEQMKNANPTYIVANNQLLGFSVPPITENDRTLVPMRFLFENLESEVTWDDDTQTATAHKGDTVISFSIDNNKAQMNGEEKVMDVPARLVNDKTMVPLRFLSEGLGYTVNWNEETRVAEVIE